MKREKTIGKLSTQGNFIVTYPPQKALNNISQKSIFSHQNAEKKRKVALYIHIPFCMGKCNYCAYTSFQNPSENEESNYLNYLKKELELYLKYSELKAVEIISIYIGGGTPTYLTSKLLRDFLSYLKEKLNIKNNVEITVEGSPETLDESKLKTLVEQGVNRLSIGIQSFEDPLLRFIGRRHDSKQAIEKFMLAKKYFNNINIDVMYGLPTQKLEDWKHTLNNLIKLKPSSITTYYTRVKPNTPLWTLLKISPNIFPSEEEVNQMHRIAIKSLTKIGYKQNPLDWFNLPGKKHQQQIQKWQENAELLALGISSYSFMNNYQYYNFDSLPDYYRAIDQGRLPITMGKKLSKEELIRRKVIFGLKILPDGVEINKEDYGLLKEMIEELTKQGFVKFQNNHLSLTEKGILVADEVCAQFFSDEVKER